MLVQLKQTDKYTGEVKLVYSRTDENSPFIPITGVKLEELNQILKKYNVTNMPKELSNNIVVIVDWYEDGKRRAEALTHNMRELRIIFTDQLLCDDIWRVDYV